MTCQAFFDKWGGKAVDYDGYYGYQCVDLYDQYCLEVLGVRPPLVNGAKDIWNSYPTGSFNRVANTPSGVPKKGDVMIWGTGVGTYGHVAIIVDANVNTFRSLDQNWPYSNGTTPSKVITHNYSGVIGWLAPKIDVNFDQAAYEAEQRRIAAEAAAAAAAAKAEADRIAALEAEKAKAEADAKAKEEAAAAKREAERIAAEQAKIDAEVAAQKATQEKWYSFFSGLINFIRNLWK
jgi:hypothetical protein